MTVWFALDIQAENEYIITYGFVSGNYDILLVNPLPCYALIPQPYP